MTQLLRACNRHSPRYKIEQEFACLTKKYHTRARSSILLAEQRTRRQMFQQSAQIIQLHCFLFNIRLHRKFTTLTPQPRTQLTLTRYENGNISGTLFISSLSIPSKNKSIDRTHDDINLSVGFRFVCMQPQLRKSSQSSQLTCFSCAKHSSFNIESAAFRSCSVSRFML